MASRIYPLQKSDSDGITVYPFQQSDSDGITVCPFQQQLIPHHVVM